MQSGYWDAYKYIMGRIDTNAVSCVSQQLVTIIWSQMEGSKQTWQNHKNKKSEPVKSYPFLYSPTTIAHLQAHEIVISGSQSLTYITVSTFDGDFALLERCGAGQFMKDPEFKQELRVKTDFPILHCHLEQHYDTITSRNVLVGYLIDIYSTLYTVNFTKAIQITQKYPNKIHPVQYTTLANASKGESLREETLYLLTPLMLKKIEGIIVSVSLKGELLLLDITQSKSWIRSQELVYQRQQLGAVALAASHNRIPFRKYDSVIVVAVHNSRTPYVFINCNSATDFENQKRGQDKYEWIQEAIEVTHCAVDPETGYVCTSNVAQIVQIFEISEGKDSRGNFYFLKKKFGFYISNNIQFSDISIDSNVENMHGGKGLLLVTTPKEQVVYDLVEQAIRKRMKGNNISMLKWGQIIDRKNSIATIFLARGYNHFNQAQSKEGKPNVHFKNIELK